jgi:hypothetical protein
MGGKYFGNFMPGMNFVKRIFAFENSLEFLNHIDDFRFKCCKGGENPKNLISGSTPRFDGSKVLPENPLISPRIDGTCQKD